MSTNFPFTQADFTVFGNGLNKINLTWEIEQVISKAFTISKLKRNNDFNVTFDVPLTGPEQTTLTTTVNNHNGFDSIPLDRFPEDTIINANIIGESVVSGTLENESLNEHISNVDIHADHTVISVTSGEGLGGGGTIDSNLTLNLDVNGLTQEIAADQDSDFLVFYDTSAAEHKKGLISDVVPPPTPAVIFDVYNNGAIQTFTNTITLALDTVRENSGDFTLTSSTITSVTAGTYLLIYRVSTDIASGSARSCSRALLELDTGSGFSEVIGSRGYMYNRDSSNADNTCTVSLILNLNVGDALRIRVNRESGSDTINVIQQGSGVTIVSVGTNGPVGPAGADGDVTWEGTWVSQNYVINQAVEYLGSSYVCISNTVSNELPTNTSFWDLLASKGDIGPTGSGSSVSVLNDGTPVTGSPFEKLNFLGFESVSQNGGDSTQVDVTFGPKYFGVLATDPVGGSPSAGDKYYNTTLNQEMYYDTSRGKWLSVALLFDGCGLNGSTPANTFYRRFNGLSLAAGTGPFLPKGTLVGISYGTTSAVSHTFEVLVGGVVIASLASGGNDTAYNSAVNVDFNQGKFSARNASGSATTPNLQATIYYRLRA